MSIKEESVFIFSDEEDEENEVVKEEITNTSQEVIKEVYIEKVDLSFNNILPDLLDFSNKSITEIFIYIKQKYEDTTKQPILDNEINEIINYYTKINCILKYNDIVIINKLLTSDPTLFDEIEKLSQDIIKNGIIETENVPHLIYIIQILYRRLLFIKWLKIDSKKISTCCVKIITFIFHSLLDKNKTHVVNLTHLDQIIETTISLLDYKSLISPKSCCSIM